MSSRAVAGAFEGRIVESRYQRPSSQQLGRSQAQAAPIGLARRASTLSVTKSDLVGRVASSATPVAGSVDRVAAGATPVNQVAVGATPVLIWRRQARSTHMAGASGVVAQKALKVLGIAPASKAGADQAEPLFEQACAVAQGPDGGSSTQSDSKTSSDSSLEEDSEQEPSAKTASSASLPVESEALGAASQLPGALTFSHSRQAAIESSLLSAGAQALQAAEDWVRDHPNLVLAAMKKEPKAFFLASKRLQTTPDGREVIKQALQAGVLRLKETPEWVRDDEELVTCAVNYLGISFRHASERLRNHRPLVELATGKTALSLLCASKELQRDLALALLALSQNEKIFVAIVRSFREVPSFKLQALGVNGLVLKYIPYAEQTLEMVLKALSQNFEAWAFVDPRLKTQASALATIEEGEATCP